MKTFLVFMLSTLITMNANAYRINVSTEGLKEDDLVSIFMQTVSSDCKIQPDGTYHCSKTTNNIEGIKVMYLQKLTPIFSGNEKIVTLAALSFKIKEKAFPSCQHLEKHGQTINVKLTETGCILMP